ncbi:MAG: hypothetical protein AAF718_05785 [Pseudomonadota bacterium]
MKRLVIIGVGLALAGAVGARAIPEHALGPGAGSFAAPASVTVCELGSASC